MIDSILHNLATVLKEKLPWLNNTYGKAYRLVDSEGNLYPAIHTAGNEYISLLPNDFLGNYSFFELEDPQQLIKRTQDNFLFKFRANLITWFNLETIQGDILDNILSDNVKNDIILALANKYHPDSYVEVVEIYESAENIFKRYSLKQVNTQFLMLPYYGYKFVLNIVEQKVC